MNTVPIIGYCLRRLITMALVFGVATAAIAEDKGTVGSPDPTEQLYRDVAGELRCPTCTGLSVLDSDAPFSVQIKTEVKTQLAEGKSRDQVLKFFVDRYGPWILRSPPVAGVNALAWIIPIAALLLGPLGIWFFVGRRVRVATDVPVRPAAEILAEMERELTVLRGRIGGAS